MWTDVLLDTYICLLSSVKLMSMALPLSAGVTLHTCQNLSPANMPVSSVITFCVSHRRCKMNCGHARLCVCLSVCLSAATCPHYCTDPDVTWGSGRGCPLVVHCLANLQSVHGLRCYDNIMRTLVTGLRPSHDITSHCRGERIRLMFPVADINATPGNCKPVTPRHLRTYLAINNCVFIHQR